jgi:hypothetical protein
MHVAVDLLKKQFPSEIVEVVEHRGTPPSLSNPAASGTFAGSSGMMTPCPSSISP